MRKILLVVRREYLQAVRTKAFWIGLLALPLFTAFMFVVPLALTTINPERQKAIAVVDPTTRLFAALVEGLDEHRLKSDAPEFVLEQVSGTAAGLDELQRRILDGELYGALIIGDALATEEDFALYRTNVGDERTADRIRDALYDAVVTVRLERSELTVERDELESVVAWVRLAGYQVSSDGEATRRGFLETYFAAYAFVFLLYFMIYLYGFSMTRGVIQEKSTRVMEVLLGSMTPEQLMTGKILGIGLVGLTQIACYAATAGAVRFWLMASGNGGMQAAVDALSPIKLLYFLVYFVCGYFMFTSLFAIVGAACSTEQEAQQMQMPVLMCLLIPLVTTIFFVKHPDSTAAVALSLVPLFTPMLMFMRIVVLEPPLWQIALSIVLMVIGILLLFRVAAKVFRIGTLMHGKAPSLAEIWRWARS